MDVFFSNLLRFLFYSTEDIMKYIFTKVSKLFFDFVYNQENLNAENKYDLNIITKLFFFVVKAYNYLGNIQLLFNLPVVDNVL